jgi:hypothetical protein
MEREKPHPGQVAGWGLSETGYGFQFAATFGSNLEGISVFSGGLATG